mmetsp:Transcript_12191/g.55455  ORF Transcript_12191/g.55455 Transcript_12191/m.55455 type:complete len:221 (-) Transcript_12191:816-1478(-)
MKCVVQGHAGYLAGHREPEGSFQRLWKDSASELKLKRLAPSFTLGAPRVVHSFPFVAIHQSDGEVHAARAVVHGAVRRELAVSLRRPALENGAVPEDVPGVNHGLEDAFKLDAPVVITPGHLHAAHGGVREVPPGLAPHTRALPDPHGVHRGGEAGWKRPVAAHAPHRSRRQKASLFPGVRSVSGELQLNLERRPRALPPVTLRHNNLVRGSVGSTARAR